MIRTDEAARGLPADETDGARRLAAGSRYYVAARPAVLARGRSAAAKF